MKKSEKNGKGLTVTEYLKFFPNCISIKDLDEIKKWKTKGIRFSQRRWREILDESIKPLYYFSENARYGFKGE